MTRLRRAMLWGAGLSLILAVVAIGFLFQLDLNRYRVWMAAQATEAIGRTVTIDGPIQWSLSPAPTLVLHNLQIANPPWASRGDFAKASNIEVTIALLPLLYGIVEIPRIVVEGLDVLLERGPSEDVNWKFRSKHAEEPFDKATGSPAGTVEIRTIELRNGTVEYQGNGEADRHGRVSVERAILHTLPDQRLRLSVSGAYNRVPIIVEATGGTLRGLMAKQGPWPLAVEVRADEVIAAVHGTIGIPIGSRRLDLEVELIGDRLNVFNPLLAVNWPDVGPLALSGRLRWADGVFSVAGLKVACGSSDLAGEGSLEIGGPRSKLVAKLFSDRIVLEDFSGRQGSAKPESGAAVLEQPVKVPDFLKSWDATIEIAAENVLFGGATLRMEALRAVLLDGLLNIDLWNAQAFGVPLRGHVDLNVKADVPSVSLALVADKFAPDVALNVAEMSEGLAGISNLVINATTHGTTWGALLHSLTLAFHLDRSLFLVKDPLSGHVTDMVIDATSGSVNTSESRQVLLLGRYGNRPFRLELTIGPLAQLFSNESWPIQLSIRGAPGHVLITGRIHEPLRARGMVFRFLGEGKNISALLPSLPALGPYRVTAQISGDIRRFHLAELAGQFGRNDVAGELDFAFEDDRPTVTAQLSSRLIQAMDFFGHAEQSADPDDTTRAPDDAALSQRLHALEAHVKWQIEQLDVDKLKANAFSLTVTLGKGRLAATCAMTVSPRGDLKGELAIDTRGEIPALTASARIRGLDYGGLLLEVAGINVIAGSGDLDASLQSRGSSIRAMSEQFVADVTAKPGVMHIVSKGKDFWPITVAEGKLALSPDKPFALSVRGEVRGVPLSLAITGISMSELRLMASRLPLRILAQGPDVVLEAQGQVSSVVTPGTADLHVKLTGSSLARLGQLFGATLPEFGPYEATGNVMIQSEKAALTGFHLRSGSSDVSGRADVSWRDSRPRIRGTFASDLIELQLPERRPDLAPSPRVPDNALTEAASTAKSVGKGVVDFASPLSIPEAAGKGAEPRIIPDWLLPVQSLRATDLDVLWTIKRLSAPPVQLDDLVAMVTLKEGLLTAGPLAFTHEGAATTGRATVDSTRQVPHVAVEMTMTNLNYGGLFKAFKITDKVEGSVDMALTAEGDGLSLRDLLVAANGHLDIVAGPAKVANRYVELWASNLMTAMFSQAWNREEFTRYHCGAVYFDLHDGEMRTDALLIDAHDHSIAAAGMLNFGAEELDVVVTPRPKDLALFSLAAPVRLTGSVARPNVSTKASAIAASKAWQVLGVADPIGAVLFVPRLIHEEKADWTVSRAENPCTAALQKGGEKALSTTRVVSTGFDWLADLMRGTGSAFVRFFGGQTAASAR